MSLLVATPGQTAGPFFGFALPYDGDSDLVRPDHRHAVRLHGTVLDGHGSPVPDALLEIWQADADGNISREPGSLRRDGDTFTGWGRAATDDAGHFSFTTVEPGPADDGSAPFFAMTILARGVLNRLFTRIYVPGTAGLATDALLTSVPEDRRGTLIARRDRDGLVFDVILQGERETVFLRYPGT